MDLLKKGVIMEKRRSNECTNQKKEPKEEKANGKGKEGRMKERKGR